MSLLEDFLKKFNFEKLNVLTKYPKILPLHKMDNGIITSTLSTANYQPVPINTSKMEIEISELIEGTISRIIILGTDFVIADDKDIIHARGDRVVTNEVVAPTYQGLMNFMNEYRPSEERFLVLYGIAYGKRLPGNKRYTNIYKPGYALIDGFTMKVPDMQNLCESKSIEELQEWNKNLQVPYWTITTRNRFAESFGLNTIPRLKTTTLDHVPVDPKKMLDWLWEFTDSKVVLDSDDERDKFISSQTDEASKETDKIPDIDPIPKQETDNEDEFLAAMKADVEEIKPTKAHNKFKNHKSKLGKSKGIVIRNNDRTYIRKICFEDYIKQKKKKAN